MAKAKNKAMQLSKRINQRLLNFEKQGLTSSREYRYLVEQIELSGAMSASKSGKVRIKESFKDVQSLFNWNKVSTAGEIMKKTAKDIKSETGEKPTKEEVKERINQSGELSRWVEENLSSVYDFSKFIGSALELEDMLHKSLRSYSYDEIWQKIREYESQRDAWRDVHGDEHDPNNQFLKFTQSAQWQHSAPGWESDIFDNT